MRSREKRAWRRPFKRGDRNKALRLELSLVQLESTQEIAEWEACENLFRETGDYGY